MIADARSAGIGRPQYSGWISREACLPDVCQGPFRKHQTPEGYLPEFVFSKSYVVGEGGFEPPTPCL